MVLNSLAPKPPPSIDWSSNVVPQPGTPPGRPTARSPSRAVRAGASKAWKVGTNRRPPLDLVHSLGAGVILCRYALKPLAVVSRLSDLLVAGYLVSHTQALSLFPEKKSKPNHLQGPINFKQRRRKTSTL